LLDRLQSLSGTEPLENYAVGLRDSLATLLGLVGGIPLYEGPLDDESDTFALQLLDEACEHALSLFREPEQVAGYFLETSPSGLPFSTTVVAHPAVTINTATTAQLDVLPGIGTSLARRIIEARRAGGWFASPQELDDRVIGVGPTLLEEIAAAVSYADPRAASAYHAKTFEDRWTLLSSLVAGPAADRLAATVELLTAVCARNPHPFVVNRRPRSNPTADLVEAPIQWLQVLADHVYHPAVGQLIDDAASSVDVCMFHMALGGAEHLTRPLLEKLVTASARGVAVRVLLDSDRPTDPYLSTVINAPAKNFLETAGVPVRWDTRERLLHSKFLVIDEATTVVGSHNWSAGSYAEFDDVSLLLESPGLAGNLRERFEDLWQESSA
jgi:competence protein ComEA